MSATPRILFRKAIIQGGAAADLFSVTVNVKPHVQDGHQVKGYTAVRHKHAPPAPAAKPKVQLEGFTPEERRLGDAATELAHRLVPDHRVRVVMHDRIPNRDTATGLIDCPHTLVEYGSHRPVLPQHGGPDLVIQIARHVDSYGKRRKEAEVLGTMLHEFGHALQMGRFFALPAEQRKPIVSQWMHEIQGMDTQKPNLSDAKQWLLGDLVTPENLDAGLKRGAMADRGYYRQFEEWFAEKFVQWMASDAPPGSAIERFFWEALALLRLAYNSARKILGLDAKSGPFEEYARRVWSEGDAKAPHAPPRVVVRRAA